MKFSAEYFLANFWRRVAWLACATIACAMSLSAQTVRGRSLSGLDSIPIPGVLVQLLNAGGQVVAQRISDPTGAFSITAPQGGSYQLRGLRIGYSPSIGTVFVLNGAATVERSLILGGIAVRLEETRVSATTRCSTRADTGSLGFRAWEQAKTALASAIATREGSGYSVDYVTSQRQWRTPDGLEQSYAERLKHSASVRTFHAPSLSILRDSGYVLQSVKGASFSGPDEEVLLSDDFTAQHCIWAAPSAAIADSIVIRFEPVPERRLPDIKGVVVLSRSTAELRSVAFEYVNVRPAELAIGAGGTISFLRLGAGGWIVREWSIRSPILEEIVSGGWRSSAQSRSTYRPVAMDEARGEIIRLSQGDSNVWSAPRGRLRGKVVDKHDSAIQGRLVSVVDTDGGVLTDSTGSFVLEDVRLGRVMLDVRPTYADSLTLTTPRVNVTADGTVVRVVVGDVQRDDDIKLACKQLDALIPRRATPSIVRGSIRDVYGAPVGDADVVATWAANTEQREVRSSRGGEYVICGLPRGTDITFAARTGSHVIATGTGRIPADGGILLLPLTPPAGSAHQIIARIDSGTATVTGAIRSRGGQPINGVQVRVVDTQLEARSDQRGEYTLRELPLGDYQLEVRQLGYGAVRRSIAVHTNGGTTQDFELERVVSLDSVRITAERSKYTEFDKRRKEALQGRFLDEAEVTRLHLKTADELLIAVPGFTIQNPGPQSIVLSARSPGGGFSGSAYCKTLILVDDVPVDFINTVPPALIGAVEVYSSMVGGPITRRSGNTQQTALCGTIKIWTKR